MDVEQCPVCATCPRVLIALAHPAMRRLILELLHREPGCWTASINSGELAGAVRDLSPDLVIIDGADFPTVCDHELAGYQVNRIVVIGRQPDPAYLLAALRHGAGAWVARDDVADQLSSAMRHALGCRHEPCPRTVT